MRVLSQLTVTQRDALLLVDKVTILFKRRSGWVNRSATVPVNTMKALVDAGHVRISPRKRDGFTFNVATLTDNGEVLVAQIKDKQARRAA